MSLSLFIQDGQHARYMENQRHPLSLITFLYVEYFGKRFNKGMEAIVDTREMSHQLVISHRSYSGAAKKRSEVKRVPFVFFMEFLSICHTSPVDFVQRVIKLYSQFFVFIIYLFS